MKIDELLKLPFFQKCIFKNYYNKQEILGRGDEIEDIYQIAVEERELVKLPSSLSKTGYFVWPTYDTVIFCIKKEEK